MNRLFGRREAIAHDMPGVTRDRVEVEATWRGRRFGLVDTAGYLARGEGGRGARRRAGRTRDRRGRPDPAGRRRRSRDHGGGRCARPPAPAGRPCRSCWSRTRWTPTGRSPTRPRSTARARRAVRGVERCTAAATGDLLDRIVALLPDAPHERDGEDAGGAAVRARRSPERGEVEPVQPPGGGGAFGRLRGGRHDARRRRRRGRVARRAACGSSTPQGCDVR